MHTTERRMVLVAVVVCGFAVGMAGLLNYFKYRSTATRLVKERLVVTGKAIEKSVQGSLALGLQFGEIGTLQSTLNRERATDDLILGIDVFDADGRMLYSTDRMRMSRPVPVSWLEAARGARGSDWLVDSSDDDAAAGMSVENQFGLTVGHLALRYSQERVRGQAMAVGRDLALASAGIFAVAATLASLAMLRQMRRLSREVGAAEAAVQAGHSDDMLKLASYGPFGTALKRFVGVVSEAEGQLSDLRVRLQRGGSAS